MKGLYAGTDGKLKVEKVEEGREFVEFDDGYHPLPTDSIYYNEKGENPIIVYFGGLLTPLGSKSTKGNITKYCAGVELAKQSGSKVSVSSKFWRQMKELRKHIGWIIILITLAYAFLSGGV